MRRLAIASVIAIALSLALGGGARADGCPSADQSADETCGLLTPADTTPPDDGSVAWFDDTGEPIPYVDEITAPPDGTALLFADPD